MLLGIECAVGIMMFFSARSSFLRLFGLVLAVFTAAVMAVNLEESLR